MLQKKAMGIVLLATVCLSFFVYFTLVDNANLDNNLSDISNDLLETDNLQSSVGEYPSNNIFFNHSSSDLLVHINLSTIYTHTDDSKTALFQHSFNNTELYNITDNSIFSADQFYYMMGLGQQIYEKAIIAVRIDTYKKTPLWDSINKGFYRQLYNNFTPITSEKFVFDNLLAIEFMLNGLGISQSYGLSAKISEIWSNVIINLFWDPVHFGLNHSTLENTTRYTSDNLYGASIAFRIAQEPLLDASLRATALTYGNLIMSKYNHTSTVFDDIDEYAGFYNYADAENQKTGGSNKFLFTNALGISALLDWNKAGSFSKTSQKVNSSIDMWRFLKSKMYNTTYNLYMTEISREGDTKYNQNMDLLFNAWMLRATLDLFKTTGNLTYYSAALKHFYGIEAQLYDNNNHGYFASAGNASNDLKRTDSYNMLIATLYEFYDIFNSTILVPTLNQSSYVYLQDSKFNVSISFNISMKFDYTTTLGSNWTINTAIPNAPVELTLRFAYNNTILNEQLSSTDSNGKIVYLYSIPLNLPVEIYKLSIMCNKSGFGLAYTNSLINYVSGLQIEGFSQLKSDLYQGEICTLNVSVMSSRKNNITISLETYGDNFNTKSATDIYIINNTRSFALVNISAKSNAAIGDQEFFVDVYNGSVLLKSVSQTITIESAVEIKYLVFNEYIIGLNPHKLIIKIFNHRSTTAESITIKINGQFVDSLIEDISAIKPLEEKIIEIFLTFDLSTPFDIITFNVNASRNNIGFFLGEYMVEAVNEVEIISIQSSTNVYHGHSPYVSISLINYNISQQTLRVQCNGITVGTNIVSHGEQVIFVAIANDLWNPYDITPKSYQIVILNSENEVLAQTTIKVTVTLSIGTVFYYYIIPIIAAIAIILVFKHKQLENEKRK